MERKRWFLLAAGCMLILLSSGCETTAGAGKGLAYGIYATGEGAVHDTQNTYSFIKYADQWLQENLW